MQTISFIKTMAEWEVNMENTAAKITKAFFDSKDYHVDVVGDTSEILLAAFGMKNCPGVRVAMFFDSDSSSAQIKTVEFVKVPEEKRTMMCEVCNLLNDRFRWAKFCIDDKGIMVVSDDAVLQLDSCGEEMLRCCVQLVGICDEAYPMIMKALYS